MNRGILGAGIVMVGLLFFAVFNIVQNYSTGSELDYYLLKDTTEAAMIDAIDLGFYRSSGQIRMDRERFVDSFTRRFAQSVNMDREYEIKMYDVNETPPKVSVHIISTTSVTFNSQDLGINTKIDAILETKYNENRIVEELINEGRLNYEQLYFRD